MAVKSAGVYTYVSFIVFCILSAGRLFGHARVEVCLQHGGIILGICIRNTERSVVIITEFEIN